MKALDTNIVLRLIVQDDQAQYATACDLLRDPVFLSLTVILETEWVLRSWYKFQRSEICNILREFLSGDKIVVESEQEVRWALGRYRAGGDFADMVHVAAVRTAAAFVTFDAGLSKFAGPDTPVPIETLPST